MSRRYRIINIFGSRHECESKKLRSALEQARYEIDFAPTKEEGAAKAYEIINSALSK